MMDAQKKMGFRTPGDERVQVPLRDWAAMRLALWRSKVAWDIAARSAEELVERCAHMEGCAGKDDETEPCLIDCPDRELRMSALVILNAARQFAPIDARKPADGPYFAPSRERFSDLMADLAAAQAELEALRGPTATEPPAQPPATKPLRAAAAHARLSAAAAAEFQAELAESESDKAVEDAEEESPKEAS